MKMDLVDKITKSQLRNDIPEFEAGDTLRVHVRIREGEKSRIQVFEGVCVGKKNGGVGETFTVRCPTVSACREHSRCTPRSSTMSKLSASVRSAGLS